MKPAKVIAMAMVATFSLQQADAQLFSHHHKTHKELKKQHKKWEKEKKKEEKKLKKHHDNK
ncbi:hypothetical protein [Mucilaginibacter ginkgonis]|uniref:Uncharacterized protein n=1 Tax=Mucilaginibacter ginkgonis TaxID=2682091 RepID=A0A6I4IN80_9SPHI|nr:hypothetical protein [Mucilaginibacter ginkgonis]QQL49420.1 hypothetical protein GO620_014780 [Mucilaginibacter ginkgonis]